ncbi:MAG: citrate/2-methylcitrate synthase, partial [Candidatus Hodarchaeales archaeon]
MENDYELFDRNTQAIIYGFQRNAIQRMLDFDFVCKREKPSVVAVIRPAQGGAINYHKAFMGGIEIIIPTYKRLNLAVKNHPEASVLINFSSFRSAFVTTKEALEASSIRTVAVIAEGIPERESRMLIKIAQERVKTIIGPATVGGIKAGAFKIGNTAGTIENIVLSKLYRPGSVGFVSKSGGMSNELYFMISQNSNGIYEGIAIGGDRYPGSTLLDHLLRFEANPKIKILVCLGEVGGIDEIEIAEAVKEGRITKPLVGWVTGTATKLLPKGLQFGHAGAMVCSDLETADAKNWELANVGVIIPQSYDEL